MREFTLGKTKKCPICGKEFYVMLTDKWVYKKIRSPKNEYYCSWTCYRKADTCKKYIKH